MDWLALGAPAFFAGVFTSIGGLTVWFFQSRAERLRSLEENLASERRRLYADALDPFIRLFAGIKDPKQHALAMKSVTSYEHRKTVFHLTLFGSDDVVRAYNGLMQHIYRSESEGQNPRELMRRWGALLLQIRRSVGNERTALSEWDMLSATIKDIESISRE